jgi:ectoine hydroxylase-related dioxygenase (phytanoyl-CoA dioxygenase family)
MSDSAAHRQTRYIAAPHLPSPDPLPLPAATHDLEQAKADLTEYGMCLVEDALSTDEIAALRDTIDRQAAAERALGELAPPAGAKQLLSNLVNKGKVFLDLVERVETDELAGYMLGRSFLLSSLTGGVFHGPTTEPQQLHRDQGQVPATVDFPAACNLFYLLDDFHPDNGSTCIVPGSHRWAPEYQIRPPSRDQEVQIEARAGTIFCWDGRLWHGTGVNKSGAPRRHVTTYCCLPWMRQQENWGVTCLQEVLDEASPKLKARLGLRTYGTLGMMSGASTSKSTGSEGAGLGNYEVQIPEYVIGENGALHPVKRTSRK